MAEKAKTEATKSDPKAPPVLQPGIVLETLKVAIVTPSQNIRGNIRIYCRELGIKSVFSYTTTAEALTGIYAEKIDLVITDWNVGSDAAGMDMIETIRKDEKINLITACIVMSGQISEEHLANAVDIEVDDFLAIPFMAQAMKDAIIRALNKRKSPSKYEKEVIAGQQLIVKKQYNEAYDILEKSMSEEERPASARYYRGYINMVFGQVEKAKDEFELALKARPMHLKSLYGRAFMLKGQSDKDKYLNGLLEVLKVFPTHAPSLEAALEIFIERKDFKEISERLDYILKVRADFPKVAPVLESQAAKGIIAICQDGKNLKWLKSAMPYLEAFAKVSKVFAERISIAFFKINLDEDGERFYGIYERDHGHNLDIQVARMEMNFARGKFGVVVDQARKAIDTFGQNAPSMKLVMEALEKLGSKQAVTAKEEYENFMVSQAKKAGAKADIEHSNSAPPPENLAKKSA